MEKSVGYAGYIDSIRIVRFTLGGSSFGIPIEDVAFIEIMKNHITAISHAPEYIKGATLLYGMLIPIYDLASRFGYVEPKAEYLIVVETKRMKLGLPIDAGCDIDIIDVDHTSFYPVPVTMNPARNYFSSVILHQERIIGLIDVNRLLPEDELIF